MKHETLTPADQGLPQRALGGHAAIGLLAGALLYVVMVTGTLAVVAQRWERWEQPAMPEMTALAPDAAQHAVVAALVRRPSGKGPAYVMLRLPSPTLPRATLYVDGKGSYVDAQGDVVAPQGNAWTEFVTDLHETLHLPSTWGLILVGGLGAMMAALTITGVLAHPRILRDAFRMRVRGDRQIAQADWHNRLGVWTLPFALAIAFTGAVLGLSMIGGTILARTYYGGDLRRAYAPVFGAEGKADKRPAPVADVSAALRVMAARFPAARPSYVTLHDPGTQGQEMQILADHPRRLIYGETYRFDAGGRFTGTLGLADGVPGKQAAASTYKLHFGSFGGLAVEVAYLLLGLACCIVTGTGMSLWLQKRRRRGMASPRLEAFWAVTVWGTPLMIVAALWLRAIAGAAAPLGGAFWTGLAAMLVAGMAWPRLMPPRGLRLALGLAIAVTAIGHALLLRPDVAAVLAIDVVLLAIGAGIAFDARLLRVSGRTAARSR